MVDVLQFLQSIGVPTATTAIIIILSFIRIPKIDINLWQLIAKTVTKSTDDKLDNISSQVSKIQENLNTHIQTSEAEEARRNRARILRFSDEIMMGQEHTKEHYDDILATIDEYEKYCNDHPDFPNNRCMIAIQNISDSYKERLQNNSFVTIERLVQNCK